MAYSKRKFGAELILQLENGFNIERTANWANQLYQKHTSEMGRDLVDLLQIIASMNFGSEFEKTEKEVEDLAIKLIEEP